MKILHTADWHLGTFRSPVQDGINLRTLDISRCLDELVKAAREEKPNFVLISGDIFHTGRLWSDRCCDEIITAVRYIKELSELSDNVIAMRGTPNHDGAGQFDVLTELFSDTRNVTIVTKPQVLEFEDISIAVLPGFDRGVYRAKFPGLSKDEENEVFTHELSNIVIGLKAQCKQGKAAVLMSHYTVPGCNTESGQLMMLTQFEPVIPPETLRAANFDLVALGHIHRPQAVPHLEKCFYSGAINAMNFNDEGQDRGFWIHHAEYSDFENKVRFTNSNFFKTPYREFLTIHLDNDDIYGINSGNIEFVATQRWRTSIDEKIVRVHYSCSSENNKALNKAVLEKQLLDDGAFMVWEILPDKVDEFANRMELAGTTDPELNLKKYLEEKQYPEEKIQELLLKARPVISEAEASITTSSSTGLFEPVEIEVKNYRNYEEEKFNFEDISFCTINGINGAGKSSLFMDAIIDCLYEQPREGIIKDDTNRPIWLRNDENARSGAIMFTFRIGGKTFRVTRTRARSGKGTLNIAEFIENVWVDRSKEKYNDTQQEILNILGMDSLTFKSCALIMQDQYGIFLQARPEERAEVLGTLLGLGVYQIMERIASDKAKIYGAKTRDFKQEVDIHKTTITNLGDSQGELSTLSEELKGHEMKLQEKVLERDKNKLLLTHRQEAIARHKKLLEAINGLNDKKATLEQSKAIQQSILDKASLVLDERRAIEEKVAQHNSLVEKERVLSLESALYSTKKTEFFELKKQEESEQTYIEGINLEIHEKKSEMTVLESQDEDELVKEKAVEYEEQKKLLDEAYIKERTYRDIEKKLTTARYSRSQILSEYEIAVKGIRQREEMLQKKAELLDNVECVDIKNAKCGFLADAIDSKNSLVGLPNILKEKERIKNEQVKPFDTEISDLEKQLENLNFDSMAVNNLLSNLAVLKPYLVRLDELNQRETKIALIKGSLENLQSNLLEAQNRLSIVKLRITEVELERDKYAQSFEEHIDVQNSILHLKPWIEKEKELPLAEERKTMAMDRILEISKEIGGIGVEIVEKQSEAQKEITATDEVEELQKIVTDLETIINSMNEQIKAKQMKIGALKQKAEQIENLEKKVAILLEQKNEFAKETADYDVLKNAFSQSGVPHQIIRSIIPQLTTTANSILGEMTGGKMGVEFRLERLQKSGKEKASLDIFIEEYGKSVLPYLSKSGGEKVKSSLSVILALAEIKSSSAGIQLGMLFIDEPPFLDGDGIQAYCDALETIQNRYSNIKIMAITHDPTMKARFPQNLDVVKTEQGSKVIY